MLRKSTIIYEYQEILMNRLEKFKISFHNQSQTDCINTALVIWDYAIRDILHWTPEIEATNFTFELASKLCLDKTYEYLGFNLNTNAARDAFDFRSILCMVYPNTIKFDIYIQTIETYKRVMKLDKWANDPTEYHFPKNFFLDNEGSKRASIALNYAISVYLTGYTVTELYELFGTKSWAYKWLREKNLLVNACKRLYNSPVEYFHLSIPSDMRDRFEYHNALYTNLYKEEIMKYRKQKKQEKDRL